MRRFFIIFLLLSASFSASAQELNGRVDVIYDRIQNVDPKVFQSLKQSLNDFINSRKWTDDNFSQNEKIDCSFLLNITGKAANENIYTATLTIQASRPVYASAYNSPTVNYQDKELTFRFDESQTLQFDDNSINGSDALVSNLTAVFAYYVYVIIGLDYDSFSPTGGSFYFKKAQNIVNNAPEQGKSIKGWKSSENNRNRYWLIDQLLNPRFGAFRTFWYTYHRKGLDLLSDKPDDAIKSIMSGIPVLTKIYNDNTSPVLLQFYFNAKSSEWVNLIRQAPEATRKNYAAQMMKIDIPNASKYQGIK
jgi:hypothetical protein